MRVRSQSDFWCGLLFAAIGIAVLIVAGQYRLGTAARMGPAYFPTLLGGLLVFLGLTLTVPALFRDGAPLQRLHWRPLLMVLLSVAVFGLALEYLGLAVAVAALVAVASLANPEPRPLETLGLAVFLVVFSIGIFVGLLGVPMPLWPGGS